MRKKMAEEAKGLDRESVETNYMPIARWHRGVNTCLSKTELENFSHKWSDKICNHLRKRLRKSPE